MYIARYVVVAAMLAAAPAPAQPSQHPRIGRLAELTFDTGSAKVAGAEQQLGSVAAWARSNPDAHVVLDGHADRRGTTPANAKLSLARARAVREQLIVLGVDPDQIYIAAYGETGAQKLNNRRVTIWGTRSNVEVVAMRSRDAIWRTP